MQQQQQQQRRRKKKKNVPDGRRHGWVTSAGETVGSQTFTRRLAAGATAVSPSALAVASQTDSRCAETAYVCATCHNLPPVHGQAQGGGGSGPADSKEGSDEEEEEEEEFVFWQRLSCSLPPAGRVV